MSITLNEKQVATCSEISVELYEARQSSISVDTRINKASALLIKLLGLTPDYELLKQVQQFVLNDLVNNHKLALSTSEKLFSMILKQVKASNPDFVKPAKNTEASERMATARKEFAKKYEHVSLENILKSLQEVSLKTDTASVELQKELIKAKELKIGKQAQAQKELDKSNISKFRKEIESMLKIQTGSNKQGEPIFSWSISKLDFVYRCLKNEAIVKKALADIK